jgi:outer membrane protein assembly factor BamB
MKSLASMRGSAFATVSGWRRGRVVIHRANWRAPWMGVAPISALLAGLMLVAIVPVSLVAAKGTPSQDWPMFHDGPAHLGTNTETHLGFSNVPFLKLAWTASYPLEAWSGSSPSIAGGVVYIGEGNGKFYAYPVGCNTNGGTCTPIWTATTGGYIDSAAAVSNGVVYVGSDDNYLYAFAVGCNTGGGTCTPIWKGATDGGVIVSSPVVANGVVYIGSGTGLYAFAVGCASGGGTCTPIWKGALNAGGISFSSPAVSGGVVYVGADDGNLYTFAVGCGSGGATCDPLWVGAAPDNSAMYSSPAVSGGVVYIGSSDGTLYAFAVGGCPATATGGATPAGTTGLCAPIWVGHTGGDVSSSPAVSGGVVYVGSADGKLYAFHVGCATGGGACSPIWTGATGAAPGAGVYSSPAVANGVVYVGSNDHKLYAFRVGCASGGGTCAPIWSYTTGGVVSSPAISNGVVYVGSTDSKLYAFSLAIAKVILSPAVASILPGGSKAYQAEAFDLRGHDLGNVTSDTTFTITGGRCVGNVCTSRVVGRHAVTATDGTARGSATLVVHRRRFLVGRGR